MTKEEIREFLLKVLEQEGRCNYQKYKEQGCLCCQKWKGFVSLLLENLESLNRAMSLKELLAKTLEKNEF